MSIQRKVASRANVHMKLALQWVPGSGKTKSALLLAYWLVWDWSKITVIDTENGSGSLYSDLGQYNTIDLEPPYNPERYIEAINACVEAGDEVIIIDSLSHEWNGEGGILQIVDQTKNKFWDGWKNASPRHQALIDKILQSPIHIIATMRSKQEYVQEEVNGKTRIKKVGTASVQREWLDYEFTVVFELDNKMAIVTKDRTQLFEWRAAHVISAETGKIIRDWCKWTSKPKVIKKTVSTSVEEVTPESILLSSYKELASKNWLASHETKVQAVISWMINGSYTKETLLKSLPQMDNYTPEEKQWFTNLIDYVASTLTSKAV